MAIYRNVLMSFWTDSKIADDFTPEDRYFYLYLFTNPHTNLCGCYEISKRFVANETGYSKETIENLLKRFEEVHNVIRYSADTKELLIINWHKYNWTQSEKFRKPLANEIDNIKCDEFRAYLKSVFNGEDTVSIPYQYGSDTTVTVTDTVTVSDTVPVSVKKARNLIPPPVEMVQDYINANGLNVDANAFVDFYASKGWMVGRTKMKDWQASVRNWSRNEHSKPSANPFVDMLKGGMFDD